MIQIGNSIKDGNEFWSKKIKVSYILSVLVFMIHCSTFSNYKELSLELRYLSVFFQQAINAVAVPLFFILSGALYFRNYEPSLYKKKTKHRIITLAIPYVLWNTINMTFDAIATSFFSQYFIGRRPFELSLKSIVLSVFHYEHNTPFWFIFALIVFVLFAPIIEILTRKWQVGVSIIVVLTILVHFNIGIPTPFFYDKTSIIYYIIGALVGRHFWGWFSNGYSFKISLISFFGGVIPSWVYFFLKYSGLISLDIVIDVIMMVVYSFSFWVSIDNLVIRTKCHDFLKRSFWVYALHMNIGAIVTKLLFFLLPQKNFIAFLNFVITIVTTLLLIELVYLITKRVFPHITNVLSGSRE